MLEHSKKYTMRISRLTIDKLGIQMYDRVSAVLAELIANSYDADAENVRVSLPFGRYLARRTTGMVEDQGYEIVIEDDGDGMTSEEINEYYLNVGYNRRISRSENTPKHGRKVMGRKGIGKLAPFGICHEVEVVSAGGVLTGRGYAVSNLILDLNEMLDEKFDENGNVLPYNPQPGPLDETYLDKSGTKLILRRFDRRRVPTGEELDRQMSARFGITQSNWKVILADSTEESPPIELGTLNVDVLEATRIDVEERPVKLGGMAYPVSGWVAYAKDPYRDEVMAGVRLYARNKIVAQTRDFDIRSGFTGEFKMRSYLTGAITAEWLDEEEDLVRTDRQDIIWNSELGGALRDWGRALLKDLASMSESSARQRIWDVFLEVSHLEDRLERSAIRDSVIRDSVLRAARLLVSRADRDAIGHSNYVERIVGLAFSVGPYRYLLESLDSIANSLSGTDVPVEAVLDIFENAQVVEMYSLGQVARERVDAIRQLQTLLAAPSTTEPQLQRLIESAPWILYPDWTPLSSNQALSSTRRNFETWYEGKHGTEITTSQMSTPSKQPDFVMLNYGGRLEVVEIKRPRRALPSTEFETAFGYLSAVKEYIASNAEVASLFGRAGLTIVCDELNLTPALQSVPENDPEVQVKTWQDILESTSRMHQGFLNNVEEMQGKLPPLQLPLE